eukprot:CAMPEP_0118926108 /NCGR_PEP_ID=MMETSP1169-20130426/3886_1 /TAXON_ID=36882 /ORGANISM="Pyramimonas obovata, Strain CCMP722" /LENGTH=271 /DNA_ID=CAMNT_0006867599 /DNA_START=118 /DNA_END=933 /DNA_ORIENTATION=-
MAVRACSSAVGFPRTKLEAHLGRRRAKHTTTRCNRSRLHCSSTSQRLDKQDELLSLVGDGSLESAARLGFSRNETNQRVEELVASLQLENPTPNPSESELLPGRWRLLSSFKPGTATVSFFSLQDWNNYLFNNGPSPVQSLVVGNSKTVSRVYQVLDLSDKKRFLNVVDFSEASGGILVIEAEITELDGPSNIKFRFCGGFFLFNRLFGRKLDKPAKVPYPVPFDLLGDRANGGLDTTYLSEDLRISVGSKGTVFVLQREQETDSISLDSY